ncbi:DUF1833 family protein [Pelagibacterium montanilacus]|uniref:DUF1833 family protein n=1 Tax=Pelagibacterium montanilacus TaxID=2185280 RepID=UPI000F8F4213|nr:DUF1833 family protein [Pelagibacterium montanilacus]
MSDPWSAALAEAYASAPADEYPVSTLELIHPQFVDAEDNQDTIRVALDERSWALTYEATAPVFAGQTRTFEPLAMRISLPEQSEAAFGTLELSLDNVPRTIWPRLQAAARVRASAKVIFRQWIAVRDLETGDYAVSGPPDMIVDQLTMKIVKASVLQLSGSAGFVDLLNRAFPRRRFDRDDFPGLHGVSL